MNIFGSKIEQEKEFLEKCSTQRPIRSACMFAISSKHASQHVTNQKVLFYLRRKRHLGLTCPNQGLGQWSSFCIGPKTGTQPPLKEQPLRRKKYFSVFRFEISFLTTSIIIQFTRNKIPRLFKIVINI